MRKKLGAVAGDIGGGELRRADVEFADLATAVTDDDVLVIGFGIQASVTYHGDGGGAVNILADVIGRVHLEESVRGNFFAIRLYAGLFEFVADIFKRVDFCLTLGWGSGGSPGGLGIGVAAACQSK